MSRADAIAAARRHVTDGHFASELARRVAIPSESPREDSGADHRRYLEDEMRPWLESMGFSCRILENPSIDRLPALFAERHEGDDLPTVLTYGHGDVLWGMAGDWDEGLDPWKLVERDGRLYGRGTVDNKGQHAINLAALSAVLEARGRLGFNVKVIIEMGEESGSPGLQELAETHRDLLSADVLIASDGPRIGADRPTVFLGARGSLNFHLICECREGAHHSGNWGGVLTNPGIRLAHALATLTDANGRIQIDAWRPPSIPENVRAALDQLAFEPGPNDPQLNPDWGEPGLQGPAQVMGFSSFEVLAFLCGRPEAPVNAVPGWARATCQLRYVVGVDGEQILPALREHLDAHGFSDIKVERMKRGFFSATRTDPDNDWVRLVRASVEETTGKPVSLLPNLGGSLPNEVFAETLGMPTVWVPHSHPACSQHAPNEHMLASVAEEGMAMMAGVWWDIGERRA
ncbi:M20 family metallopeptidase [Roseitranquillus sediminis]|uniref:M20 family metallopeptidase n=1 Tax=Roseitranquillus sediminis TaxID=2809051 RepID=UPI001D0CDB7D|nr:M20 family metallopeptidase [Roseitranquillus sediminis]MBM9595436.1 M20 family metallopeptidase [Roseitranquillus sediminis]